MTEVSVTVRSKNENEEQARSLIQTRRGYFSIIVLKAASESVSGIQTIVSKWEAMNRASLPNRSENDSCTRVNESCT